MRSVHSLGAALVAAALAACGDATPVTPLAQSPSADVLEPTLARGALVAQQVCAQCHGITFEGGSVGAVTCPALSVVRDYSQSAFNRLLVQGVAADGEYVGSAMQPDVVLDEEDRAALFLYFRKIVDTP